jgi:hypothetical protein
MRRKIIRRIYDLLGDEERKVFMIVGRSIITKVSGYKVLKNGKPMSNYSMKMKPQSNLGLLFNLIKLLKWTIAQTVAARTLSHIGRVLLIMNA